MTRILVLATILQPDGGRAEVLGHDVLREPDAVRRSIGLAGQNAAVDPNLTGRENLRMVGLLSQLSRPLKFLARMRSDLEASRVKVRNPLRNFPGVGRG